MKSINFNKIFPASIFIIIYSYLLINVLIPYFRFDQFQFWDSAGHYFSAWLSRNYFFPSTTGWNPFFSCGFPQDTFYAPIYHYLIVLLSFPFGLELAFKLVNAASIAVLPLALNFLARKFNFNQNESAGITFLAMIPVAGLGLACGGTLFSQFVVGLGTNSLGLPLFLFYIGKLKEEIDKFKGSDSYNIPPADFAILTLLAAAIVLTHFVITFAAIVAAFIFIANAFSKKLLVFAAKHALMIFLLSSFFLVPLIAYSKYIEDASTILSMGFFLTIPNLLLMLLGGAVSIWDQDKRFDKTFFIIIAVFALSIFLDFGQIALPMHAYRFVIYFMIFAMFLPIKLIFNNIENKLLKNALLACFIVLLLWQFSLLVVKNPRYEVNYNRLFNYNDYAPRNIPFYPKIQLDKLNGRVMLLDASDRLTPRATEHFLARATGNYFLNGLFGDTLNARYILALPLKMIGVFSSGENASKSPEFWAKFLNAKKLLKHFQVNYILSSAPIKNAEISANVPVRKDRPPFLLYKMGDDKIAELLPYQPNFTENNWNAAVYQWFENLDSRILVKAKALPKTYAGSADAIESINVSPAKISFKVSAKENVPVLIKMSYFPRWSANADGKQIKIYQVAPALMLIYGKGDIKLEYMPTLLDRISTALTIFGIFLLLFESLRKKKHHQTIA